MVLYILMQFSTLTLLLLLCNISISFKVKMLHLILLIYYILAAYIQGCKGHSLRLLALFTVKFNNSVLGHLGSGKKP